VDANQGYTVSEALAFVAAVRAVGIELRWFEEPTRWHTDFRGLRDVRLRGNIPVAAGQSEISRVGMRELMVNGAIDVSNYDASWGGGPTEWRRVAALAASFDVQVGHHEEAQIAPSSSMAIFRSRRRPGLVGNSTPRSSNGTGSMPDALSARGSR
jgi:L-alanine-DL-glutamate epimerase-like enolase superfamily enzyme